MDSKAMIDAILAREGVDFLVEALKERGLEVFPATTHTEHSSVTSVSKRQATEEDATLAAPQKRAKVTSSVGLTSLLVVSSNLFLVDV